MTNITSIKSARVDGTQWSDKSKIKLVQEWLRTGNLTSACKTIRIPYNTALEWKRTEWWKELSDKYREEMDIRLSSKIDTIVEHAVDEILERIENGEHILDSKTGDVIRIPAKARDLATITKFLTDRQDILIKRKKIENTDTATIKDKLSDLAAHFASFVKQTNVKPPEIIEGTFEMINTEKSDALHDQWKTGLQERESTIQQQTQASKE